MSHPIKAQSITIIYGSLFPSSANTYWLSGIRNFPLKFNTTAHVYESCMLKHFILWLDSIASLRLTKTLLSMMRYMLLITLFSFSIEFTMIVNCNAKGISILDFFFLVYLHVHKNVTRSPH